MSIERRQRKKGVVYVVWWREGRRNRNRTFARKKDAESFEAKITLLKRSGALEGLDAGKQRLDDFIAEWWEMYAQPRLAAHTLASYARLRERYVLPKLGGLALSQLSPQRLQRFQFELAKEGVGQETIRRTLAMLQGICQRAVEWERIGRNPVRAVAKPSRVQERAVRPFAPQRVEDIRRYFLGRERHRDATLVSVLAYAGLRPSEALALTWRDVGQQTLLVERALALGESKETKTRKRRTVRLLRPLAADLSQWRLASGRPDEKEPVFPSSRQREFWSDSMYRNWRRKRYLPAARAVGIESARPYDLRHSFASLLFAEGINPAEIAEQMGHSLQTLLGTYTHVIEELRGRERRPAETLIRQAREERVTQTSHAAHRTDSPI